MPYKILIVEEEPNIRIFAKMFLEERKYIAETADTLSTGLDMVKTKKFDAAILDVNIPDAKWHNWIQSFKESSPHTLLFVMASDVDTQGKEIFLKMGADEAFSKSGNWFLEMDQIIEQTKQKKQH